MPAWSSGRWGLPFAPCPPVPTQGSPQQSQAEEAAFSPAAGNATWSRKQKWRNDVIRSLDRTRRRHRALVPAGRQPGSASVRACACLHGGCACSVSRMCVSARGWCHTLSWARSGCPEGQQLLGDVPQGTGAGVSRQTSATCTPRSSHAGGLNSSLKPDCLAQHQLWGRTPPKAFTIHQSTRLQPGRMGKTLNLALPKRAAG